MLEKLLTFDKLVLSYVQDKEKILSQISKSLKILQNQIDHYNYVKNTNPSQDFLSKFENVQTIVLEKINKRIENEMKEFIDTRTQYISLFNEMKSAAQILISDLKIGAKSLDSSKISTQQINMPEDNQVEIKSDTKSKAKCKRKSMTDKLGKSAVDSEMKCITSDGLCVVTESLKDILILENINIVKLINFSTYEMMQTITIDSFRHANEKFKTLSQLIHCFL